MVGSLTEMVKIEDISIDGSINAGKLVEKQLVRK